MGEGGREGGREEGREGRREGRREGGNSDILCGGLLPTESIYSPLFISCTHVAMLFFLFFFLFLKKFFMVLPGMTQLTRKSPIAANFKGFPGTNSLTSPPKDEKENLLLNF